MPKNFSDRIKRGVRAGMAGRDPKLAGRVIVGALLFANLIAFSIAMGWWGGSPEALEQQVISLRQQILKKRTALQHAKQMAAKVDLGRGEGDKFLSQYFLPRRSAYSAVVSDLMTMAKQSQIQPREVGYVTDPVEGSETLSMMSITANYEGTYADLLHFINELDRSPRLLIIETLNAAPQQGTNRLSVALKIDTFVREDGGALPPVPGMPAEPPAKSPAEQPAKSKEASGQ